MATTDQLTDHDFKVIKAFEFALSQPTEAEQRVEILRQSVEFNDDEQAREALTEWNKLERTSEEQKAYENFIARS